MKKATTNLMLDGGPHEILVIKTLVSEFIITFVLL